MLGHRSAVRPQTVLRNLLVRARLEKRPASKDHLTHLRALASGALIDHTPRI